ncbi:helicase-related protein [Endozoicomonas gorgoniicola]|uniref:Helicase-related protein n=1 Tax=Endozoicomonas gorgoniicola TaxID=1234144 RepID=A0ABT3MXD8_9GAMM|nr:helicase-related protein [Endozoicomonas gorgoniicola]MCW7554032.1 helicase-related protein [Endozoicomonas gorgoniicola]
MEIGVDGVPQPLTKPVKVQLFGEGDRDSIPLPLYFQKAYEKAEEFSEALSKRAKGAGFFKTLLLRRIGSTLYSGQRTVDKLLSEWAGAAGDEQEFSAFLEDEDDMDELSVSDSMKDLTPAEIRLLKLCKEALESSQDKDPKYLEVQRYLFEEQWLESGCIIFSQYYDSVWWLATQLSKEHLPDEPIVIYAGASCSGIMTNGLFRKINRDDIKKKVRSGQLRLVLGTDAASEGLNLQRLGTLINLDLPWNPTRLEQRKGRIQRIGQIRDTVKILNMRYRGSVEDRVHELLSDRLEDIHGLFGQIPDVLEDVWVDIALGEVEEATKLIDGVKHQHPFDEKYSRVESIDWESCRMVLSSDERRDVLSVGW